MTTIRELKQQISEMHKKHGVVFSIDIVERVTGQRKKHSHCTKAELEQLLAAYEQVKKDAPRTYNWKTVQKCDRIVLNLAKGRIHTAHIGCATLAEAYKLIEQLKSIGKWFVLKSNPLHHNHHTNYPYEIKVWNDESDSVGALVEKLLAPANNIKPFRTLKSGQPTDWKELAKEHILAGAIAPLYPQVSYYLETWQLCQEF